MPTMEQSESRERPFLTTARYVLDLLDKFDPEQISHILDKSPDPSIVKLTSEVIAFLKNLHPEIGSEARLEVTLRSPSASTGKGSPTGRRNASHSNVKTDTHGLASPENSVDEFLRTLDDADQANIAFATPRPRATRLMNRVFNNADQANIAFVTPPPRGPRQKPTVTILSRSLQISPLKESEDLPSGIRMPFPVIETRSERGNAYKGDKQENNEVQAKANSETRRKKEPPKKCPVGSDASRASHYVAIASRYVALLRAKLVMH